MTKRSKVNCEICGSFLHNTKTHKKNKKTKITLSRKKLIILKQKISRLIDEQHKNNRLFEEKIGDLSREILDIIEPPKKGYLRFKTTTGWVSFLEKKKRCNSPQAPPAEHLNKTKT